MKSMTYDWIKYINVIQEVKKSNEKSECPFYSHGLTLILASIGNCIYYI